MHHKVENLKATPNKLAAQLYSLPFGGFGRLQQFQQGRLEDMARLLQFVTGTSKVEMAPPHLPVPSRCLYDGLKNRKIDALRCQYALDWNLHVDFSTEICSPLEVSNWKQGGHQHISNGFIPGQMSPASEEFVLVITLIKEFSFTTCLQY